MTTSKQTLIALSIASAALSINAHAKDGFSIGSIASNATLTHTIERNTGSNTTPSLSSRVEESDFAYGLSVGYQFHIADNFFLGAEAFYQDQNIESRNLNNLLITELSLDNTYGVKLKAGVDITDKFSVYGLLGQTTLEFDVDNSYPFAPPTRSASRDVDELTIGFGAEYAVNDNWSISAEFSQLNDVSFDPIPEVAVPGKINDNELDFSSISFGVNYNF